MEYSKEFIGMLEEAKEAGLYAGTGNPNAKILIIGKELAIDKEENREQVKQEIDDNILKWKKNVADGLSQNDSLEWENPLYLYKHSKQKEGHTWNKYQKLMDYIRDVPHTEETNFQEFAFLTEYNQNPSKNSAQQDKDDQTDSVKERDEFFRSTSFFQQFPIVIVAAGDYGGYKFGVELEKTFGVKHQGTFELKKGEWYSLHYAPGKLVVHTRQLSTAVSDKLLEEIAQKVKDFMREQHIEL